jgi:hypothetical protein
MDTDVDIYDMNGVMLYDNDTVFNINLFKFGKVTGSRTRWSDMFRVEEEPPMRLAHRSTYWWSSNLTLKVDPDTPQNRLALQIKYA